MSQSTTPSGAELLAIIQRDGVQAVQFRALTRGNDIKAARESDEAYAAVATLIAERDALRDVVEATLEACEANIIKNAGDEDAVGVLEDAARDALARTPAKENDDG